MKKTMILAAAALVAGSALAAEVLSVNAVGFVQTEAPAGKYVALSYPFHGDDPAGVAWTNTTIAKEAAGGSAVYFWNGQSWDSGALTKTSRATNWAATVRSKIIEPGEGFFFKPASGDATTASFERPYDWPAADGE